MDGRCVILHEWCLVRRLGNVKVGGLVRLRGGCVGLSGRSGGRRNGAWKGSKSRVWRIVNRVRSWVAGKGRGAGKERERAKNWRSRVSPRKSSIVPAHQGRFKRRDCCIQLQID